MKVAELRSALETRGLDSTGKKQELQERLRAALEHEAASTGAVDSAGLGPEPGQTEQPVSQDERAPGRDTLAVAASTPEAPAPAASDETATGCPVQKSEDKVAEAAAEGLSVQEGEDEKGTKKLTDEELEEFLSPSEREEVAKTKARASRFGVPYTGLPTEMRRAALSRYHKRRRFERMLERHGGLVPVDDAEEERRRKRMERFGLPKPVLELEAEERERQRQERKAKRMSEGQGPQTDMETKEPDTLSPPQAERHERERGATQSQGVDA